MLREANIYTNGHTNNGQEAGNDGLVQKENSTENPLFRVFSSLSNARRELDPDGYTKLFRNKELGLISPLKMVRVFESMNEPDETRTDGEHSTATLMQRTGLGEQEVLAHYVVAQDLMKWAAETVGLQIVNPKE